MNHQKEKLRKQSNLQLPQRNLTKEVKHLNLKNYKTLKKFEEETNKV